MAATKPKEDFGMLGSRPDSLLAKINRCQSRLANAEPKLRDKLKLPQIIVVGEQSAGKSSVLCNLTQFDLFPRRDGMCTRAVIVVQMTRHEADVWKALQAQGKIGEGVEAICCVRVGNDTKMSSDPSQVSTFIDEATDLLLRHEQNGAPPSAPRPRSSEDIVRGTQIVVELHSTKVENLTVVDLPGIVAEGMKPQLAPLIGKMVADECQKPNSIILAVHPAGQDVSASQGLGYARKYDPTGERTICVITKLDKNPEQFQQITAKSITLKNGYFGVVCRRPEDFETDGQPKLSLAKVLEREEQFFAEHLPLYATSSCGTKHLRRRLAEVLQNRISRDLPMLHDVLQAERAHLVNYLTSLGDKRPEGAEAYRLASKLVGDFVDRLRDLLDGRGVAMSSSKGEEGGAKLKALYVKLWTQLDAAWQATVEQEKIDRLARNGRGWEGSIAPPREVLRKILDVLTDDFGTIRAPIEGCLAAAREVVNELANEVLRTPDATLVRMPSTTSTAFIGGLSTSRAGAGGGKGGQVVVEKDSGAMLLHLNPFERFPPLYNFLQRRVADVLSKHHNELLRFFAPLLQAHSAHFYAHEQPADPEPLLWVRAMLKTTVHQLADIVPKMTALCLIDQTLEQLRPEVLFKDKSQEEVISLMEEKLEVHVQRVQLEKRRDDVEFCLNELK